MTPTRNFVSPKTLEKIVVNTGPLISLAAGEVIRLLDDLPHEFLVPNEVKSELENGEGFGRLRVDLSGTTIVELMAPLDAVTSSLLDSGEAAVIQYALGNKIDTVCIDEKKGRRLARAVNLEVVGTLGLLLEAKKLGVLDAISPVIEKLMGFGVWYDSALVKKVLTFAGE